MFDIVNGVLNKAHWIQGTTTVEIPFEVDSIASGNQADYAFIELKDKTFSLSFAPNCKITNIGGYAFNSCENLQSIDFNNAQNLKYISHHAFFCCTSIENIVFPASLEHLYSFGPFWDCSSLTSVTFPENTKITGIGSGSFGRTAITTFFVPKSVTSIDGECFSHTPLREFIVSPENQFYADYEGSLFNKNYSIIVSCRRIGEITFHPDTTTVEYSCFTGYNLEDFIIPKQIVAFHNLAFYGFGGETLTISSPFPCISARMFEGCRNLKELRFLGDIGNVEPNSFALSPSIRKIFLPAYVGGFPEDAFDEGMFKYICFYGNVAAIKKLNPTLKIHECYVLNKLPSCCNTFIKSRLNAIFKLSFLILNA